MSRPSRKKVQSSDDLLKSAWDTIGKTDHGGRAGGGYESSSDMSTSAGTAATESSEERAISAEEIARLLAEETARREGSSAGRRARTDRGPAPPRQAPRPRRTDVLSAPPRGAQQPAPVPQSQRVPEPANVPRGGQEPAKKGGRSGLGWLVFVAIWGISAVIGLVGGGDSDAPDISIEIPDISLDLTLPPTSVTLPTSPTADGTLLNIGSIDAGGCIASLPSADVIDAVEVVSCSEPHHYEVFATTDLSGEEATYPGIRDVVNAAQEACSEHFLAYLGEPFESSPWIIQVITPTESGWNDGGDRAVKCLVYQWDYDADDVVTVTETARDSGTG